MIVFIFILLAVGVIWVVMNLLLVDWMPWVLLSDGYDAHDSRLVCQQLAQAMADGHDLGLALNPCVLTVNGATRRRIWRFQQAWDDDPDVVMALNSSEMLPPAQLELLRAVETTDQRLIQRTLARFGANGGHSNHRLGMAMTIARWELVALAVILLFISVVIAPKFEQIYSEMGLQFSDVTAYVIAFGRVVSWLGLFLLPLGIVTLAGMLWLPRIIAGWWTRLQLFQRRHHQRQLLFDGVAMGLPEAALGRLVGSEATQFSQLTAAVGLRAATPQALAAEVERAHRRLRHRQQLGMAVLTVAIPLLMCVVVGVVVIGLFSPLIEILHVLAQTW